jgi:hypothetical protein
LVVVVVCGSEVEVIGGVEIDWWLWCWIGGGDGSVELWWWCWGGGEVQVVLLGWWR